MSAQGKSEVNGLLESARALRQKGDRASALAAFQAAAEADGDTRSILVETAAELRALDRLDEAAAMMEKVLGAEPDHVGALIEKAHIAARTSRFSDAVAALQAAAKMRPEHAGIQIEIARNLRLGGHTDDAVALLRDMISADPDSIDALIELGHCHRRAGNRTEALAAFEQAGKLDPARPGARLERATELRALGRSDEAESVLRDLIQASPGNNAAVVSLGYMMLETGRLGEADTLLGEAFRADPRNARLAAALARCAKLRNNADVSIDYLRQALEIAPADIDSRTTLAAELRERARLDEAAEVIRATPDDMAARARILLEAARILKGREPDAAKSALKRIADAPEADAAILVAAARELWALGDPAGARMLAERALEKQPGHPGALIASAEFALLSDDRDLALKRARDAIKAQPDQLGGYLLASRAAALLLDREDAIGLLDEARSRLGPRPEILATHIHILRLFRDYASARGIAASAHGEGPENSSLWAERMGLAIATGDFAAAESTLARSPPGEEARTSFMAGRLAEGRRNYAAASAHYDEALDRKPGQPDWHSERARASLLNLDLKEAEAHLHKSVALGGSARIARGQTRHASQTFLGQLIQDFALDRGVLADLKAASSLPAARQLDALRMVVRANPDSTAAAVTLMLAMRRAGRLEFTPGRVARLTPSKIPRRIVQFWDANAPVDVRNLMASWEDPQGRFEHLVFDETRAATYLAANCGDEVVRAFKRATHPAQRADIFRLAYLARDGGHYVDADDRRVASFEALAPKGTAFVGYQEDYGTLANNFLAAAPGHPVIQRALDLAVAAVNRGDSDTIWLSTGPGLTTRAFAQLAADPRSSTWLDRTMIRELHEMHTLIAIHCPTAYKRTDRHWSRVSTHASRTEDARAGNLRTA